MQLKIMTATAALALALATTPIIAPNTANAQEAVDSISSPDGQITVSVSNDGEGRLLWSLSHGEKQVIAPSGMGFLFANADPMRRGFTVTDITKSNIQESSWTLPWGERETVIDRHKEMAITVNTASTVENDPDRSMTIRFRVFDNGIGFRYEFPERSDGSSWQITEEQSEFNLATGGNALWIQGGDWNRYEYLYQKTPIAEVTNAHTPITMMLNNGIYLSFHEAALVDYSGMRLKHVEGLRFISDLAPAPHGAKVERTGAFTTPWRTIRIADNAPALYDNDLELNLNEPNVLGDVSWVKPYKYIGIWWEMHLNNSSWASGKIHGATTENALRHLDYAAENGFRGVLIEGWNKCWDGNWFGNGKDFSFTEAYPDFDIKKVTDYARKKGVRLIGHHETGGNIAVYESQLEDAMTLYGDLGVDSVKTGYVADGGGIIDVDPETGETLMQWHDSQRMARHHVHVAEVAAQHKVAVNAHEPIKDTGLRRTYPNMVAREGARGMEYQAWGVPGNGPDHVPSLYFTRMLSGPMDYTPGVFSLKGRDGRDLPSTLARQLALYLVIYSPIQMAADLPENLAKYPRAMDFVRHVPVDWKESITLAGEPGDYAIVARQDKASKDWYIGGVTDGDKRTQNITLDFLPKGTKWKASIWRDGDNADYRKDSRHDMEVESKSVTAGDTMAVTMAPGGGFAIRLQPAQ